MAFIDFTLSNARRFYSSIRDACDGKGLNNMGRGSCKATRIYGDIRVAIDLSKNPVSRQRSKHIDIRHHFLREIHLKGKIEIVYCPTEEMVADIFTKPATNARSS